MKQAISKVTTEGIISMAKFLLKNNYFEFNEKVSKQISGPAMGTKFAPPYVCIFMNEMEASFLKTQQLQPFTLGLDILMIYFLYEHMVKNNVNYFSKILRSFMQT